jgi:hypothetical protein
LTLEDLKENRLKELNKIFSFLGLKELTDNNQFNYVKNDASSKQIPNFIKSQYWFRIMQKANKNLAEKIAYKLANSVYKKYLKKPELSEIINQDIVDTVKKDALEFKKTFNIDISKWNLSPDLSE